MDSAERDAEAQLVLRAQRGDDWAFEEIVRRRQGFVRGLLRRLSGSAALGDDLAQETFLQMWRTLRQLRNPFALSAWLRRLSVNVWLQHARRRTWKEEELEVDIPGEPPQLDRAVDLDRALESLRAQERLCIVLAYAEGMSHSEIAELTGFPLGSVKSLVSRASAKLRTWLDMEAPVRPGDSR